MTTDLEAIRQRVSLSSQRGLPMFTVDEMECVLALIDRLTVPDGKKGWTGKKCSRCNGTGYQPNSDDAKPCNVCGGTGDEYIEPASSVTEGDLEGLTKDEEEAVSWIKQLARICLEQHRYERVKHGHHDMVGKWKNADQPVVGLAQDEIDKFELGIAAIDRAHAIGLRDGAKGVGEVKPREIVRELIHASDCATRFNNGLSCDCGYYEELESRTLPIPPAEDVGR